MILVLSTDCNDYWCSISNVIWGLLLQLHRNTSIMHHIVALYHHIKYVHVYSEYDGAYNAYVVAYYIMLAMRNESTMVKSKKIHILYYYFTLQCMIKLSIWFDHHVVCLTETNINMDIVYL